MNKRVFLLMVCLLASPMASAKCYIASENRMVRVGYFNGANTPYDLARDNVIALESVAGKKVELFYNQTQGLLLDVLETWQQRVAEGYPALADRVDVMSDMLAPYGATTQALLNSGEPGIVRAIHSFREAVLGLERKVMTQVSAATAQDYRAHQVQLRRLLQEKNARAVLVAHSQGNLFANRAYAVLSPGQQKQTTLLHIAPASVQTQGDYLLSDLDRIIEPLATADGRAPSHMLSWLEARTSKNADWTGHGFREVYLNAGLPFVKPIMDGIGDEEGSDAELYGSYRWAGSIDYRNAKGSAWVKATLKGKTGTWQAGNGCEGDVRLEPDGKGRWQATVRTLRGDCPAELSGTLIAKDGDASRIAVLPFGVGEWVADWVQPRLVEFGVKGTRFMECTGV